MTDQTAQTPTDDQIEGPVLAEGVDEEPIESNRRLFTGWLFTLMAGLAFFYAAFHMAALNGWSLSGLIATPASISATLSEREAASAFDTLRLSLGPEGEAFEGNSNRRLLALAEEVSATAGNADEIATNLAALEAANDAASEASRAARDTQRAWSDRLFFLPTFPLETWNFRIIHIAGALALGFALFSAHSSFQLTSGQRDRTKDLRVTGFAFAAICFAALCEQVIPLFLDLGEFLTVVRWIALAIGLPIIINQLFWVFLGERRSAFLPIVTLLYALPALYAAYTVTGFIGLIGSEDAVEIGGRIVWVSAPPASEAFANELYTAYLGIYEREIWHFGLPLLVATFGALTLGWFEQRQRGMIAASDLVLGLCAAVIAFYLIPIYDTAARNSVGTPNVPIGVAFAATAGAAMIMELTRRVAGLALVIITGVFLVYTFTAHLMPGILAIESAYSWQRFFGFLYTDAGILGPTTAVSSTYIILFIIFAAFLQASKVGDYFVNFAFAAAGRARGGPAKVAIFASGLMGMINGTSAGNVVATGSLTIPLMKKVGYQKKTAGAIEAAASTGGQIMPPIMGAGAFIMAEITGIPYQDIAIAAIIPAILYFASIYFMVDFEAAKLGMRGMREDELPKLKAMARRVFLFLPIIILIAALFMGYSVIRAGTLATAAAAVVSWFTPYRMGIKSIIKAFELAGTMCIQIIAVCACAGIIVGVISLTGVGARFSSVLLDLAGVSQLLALFFAMCIAILLGMGMPTTAAYAVAASVVAPGLVQLGIPTLTAHFFVFYFAVVSAITPPVALASYAAAGISGANPMETSMASFKIGIAAFIVPFMFFYNGNLLMQGPIVEVAGEMVHQAPAWYNLVRAGVTAIFGIFLLSSGIQGWFLGTRPAWFLRAALIVAALLMIEGGIITDLIGVGTAAVIFLIQRIAPPAPDASIPVRGAD